MLIKSLIRAEFNICHRIFSRGVSTKQSWDIVTGVCIERLPVVTPPLNDIQKRYKDLLYTLEFEKSMKSDHELRHENDKIQAELLKKETVDVDLDAVSKITAQDYEDASNEELAKFQFASVDTDADKKGDKTSPERCLQRHLVLVAPIKLGSDVKTLLPQGMWQEGETLRQTAERIVKEQCGPELNVQFLSNAPCGFYKYKYPSEVNGKVGAKSQVAVSADVVTIHDIDTTDTADFEIAISIHWLDIGKVFFYYANYKSGNTPNKANWLNRKELQSILPERYNKSVREFLLEETY